VLTSCARTGKLLVVHEAVQAGGFGAEIAATAAEATGCRIRRLGAPRIPVGYAPVLEAQSRIGLEAIAAAVRAMLA
jgi:pyruvate dehydrogenase E1 component beta subunit